MTNHSPRTLSPERSTMKEQHLMQTNDGLKQRSARRRGALVGAGLGLALLLAPLPGAVHAAQPHTSSYCDGAGASVNDTCYGQSDLYNENGGYNNSAFGNNALFYDSTGHENVADGMMALYSNTSGYYNTAVGTNTLINSSTGYQDTAVGDSALYSNTTGSNDTAFGFEAGQSGDGSNANTTGSGNTFVGAYSGPGTSTQLTNATAIGVNATVAESNALVLGAPGTNVGIGATAPDQALEVAGNVHIAGSGNGIVFPDGSVQKTAASGTGLPSGQSGQYLRYGNGSWQASAILAGDLPAGSGNYLQNTTSLQTGASFNIDGNGALGGTLTVGKSAAIAPSGGSGTLLQVGAPSTSYGSFLQLPIVTSSSAPPTSMCNSTTFAGRVVLQATTTALTMWGCSTSGKWVVAK